MISLIIIFTTHSNYEIKLVKNKTKNVGVIFALSYFTFKFSRYRPSSKKTKNTKGKN